MVSDMPYDPKLPDPGGLNYFAEHKRVHNKMLAEDAVMTAGTMAAMSAHNQHKARVAAEKQQAYDNATPGQRVALTQFWAREAARIRHNRLVGIICAVAILASSWSVAFWPAWTFIGVSVVSVVVFWRQYKKPGSHARWVMPDGSDDRNGQEALAPESSPTRAAMIAQLHEDGRLPEVIGKCLQGKVANERAISNRSTIQVVNVDDDTIRVANGEVWADVDLILSNGSAQSAHFHVSADDSYEWGWDA
jgi:hypothetical protein